MGQLEFRCLDPALGLRMQALELYLLASLCRDSEHRNPLKGSIE